MLDFVKYLKENFKVDTSSAEKIIQSKWEKVVAIIKEAFDDQYSDRKTALFRIQNEFVDKKVAPSTIDIDFLKNNMDYVIEKVNSLDEGEIRIIINNDVQKGAGGASVTGMETESKRGRKKKVVEEEADETDNKEGGDKTIKVTCKGNKVIVDPSAGTGLEKSEHEFENVEEAHEFRDTLKDLFKGFDVEIKEDHDENAKEDETDDEPEGKKDDEAEEEMVRANLATVNAESMNPMMGAEEEATGEDTGDEPEDAGDEPEDAGDEPEDAGDEPEDAGDEFNWEDIMSSEDGDSGEEEVPVRSIGSMEFDVESLDLSKLINKLIKVEDRWYKVTSISEDKEIIGIDKEGKENKFNFKQISEMECEIEEMCGKDGAEECMNAPEKDAEECMNTLDKGDEENMDSPEKDAEEEVGGLEKALTPEQFEEVKTWITGDGKEELSDDTYEALMDHYSDEMPYGAQKARTEDPYEWLFNKISSELGGGEEETQEPEPSEEEMDEPKVGPTAEESLSFANLANKYMDIDEDAPSMSTTQTGGATSKPGVINQKIIPIKSAPKTPVVKGPTAALTAKPSKPGETLEKVPAAPSAPAKKGPSTALTAKPKAPPKKIEKIGSAPKSTTKAAPKGNYTVKPGKTGQKVEKIGSPDIPSEYSKGGFKG